ncbi:hypothetical protein, partial [Pseudomonas syringae]|uniref:hypothetical protein n=1 Tax=Pseudomonas syringae TaxID=317 RepID=UPI001E3C9DB4
MASMLLAMTLMSRPAWAVRSRPALTMELSCVMLELLEFAPRVWPFSVWAESIATSRPAAMLKSRPACNTLPVFFHVTTR